MFQRPRAGHGGWVPWTTRREGCRGPGVTAIHATTTAAGGRAGDLEVALLECREVLAPRLGNTERAWDDPAIVAAMIDGRLSRALVPPPARHVARRPAREARRPRFLRAGA